MGEAAAADATGYKALVCVFLHGGNDNANTLVPYHDAGHAAYRGMRPTMAHSRDALAATLLQPRVALAGGAQYALAPRLAPLLPLFDQGHLAVQLNVGTLVRPTTKAQYLARSVSLPPKLFSHNDQQSIWQSSASEGARVGWGGRMGDLFAAANGNATFTCINVSGNAVFLSGDVAVQYQVSPTGPVPLNAVRSPLYGSSACSAALRTLATAPRGHVLEQAHARVMARALEAGDALNTALAARPTLATAFPTGNGLADQLKLVARMIATASSVGARRQVFFVGIGGFDTHLGLAGVHPGLLGQVADALAAFHAATVELGVAQQVTAFTASEFGRTFTGTDGSDHGWGAEHFVVGGAVHGGLFYGQAPVVANNGPDDVGQGRMLPTTSVDQFGATLGRWFGVGERELLDVFPALANWDESQRDLGFL